MKSEPEITKASESEYPQLSPEQQDQVMSQYLKVHKLKPPTPRQEQTRRMMKAYLDAPIETRHLAARKAAEDLDRERDQERYVAELSSRRRYDSGISIISGLLGLLILPISVNKMISLNDRWLSGLVMGGLCGGWVVGAAYIYPLFYNLNGTLKPHTVRLQALAGKWRH